MNDLHTVLVSAIVSGSVGIIIALIGWSATIRASRQQAIETERLRLRYDVAKRRIACFERATVALERYVTESDLGDYSQFNFMVLNRLRMTATLAASVLGGERVETATHRTITGSAALAGAIGTWLGEKTEGNREQIGRALVRLLHSLYRTREVVDEVALDLLGGPTGAVLATNRRKLKWAMMIAVSVLLAAGATWAYSHHRSQPKAGYYSVMAHCTNCDWEGEVRVPEGELVEKVACPRCQIWDPSGPAAVPPLSGEVAGSAVLDLEAIAEADRQWLLDRRSGLVTRGTWELMKAAERRDR